MIKANTFDYLEDSYPTIIAVPTVCLCSPVAKMINCSTIKCLCTVSRPLPTYLQVLRLEIHEQILSSAEPAAPLRVCI